MAHTVIVGAGPAGLTAAYELARRGERSTLLEADRQVGGLSRTVNYRGYRFDIGGHRFFSKVPLVNKLWKEILQEDFLLRPRLSRIHYQGRFFDYPLRPANALAGLGLIEAARVGLCYLQARASPVRPERTFEDWVSNRFGRRLYEIFFQTYTEKVWGIPCREISADWAAQRIKNLSLTEAVRNAILGKVRGADGQVIATLIDRFHYPRLGPGMMWERCEALLERQGNPTLRGMAVEQVRHRGGRVDGVRVRENGQLQEIGADQLVSTMPLRELIRALDPPPPAEVLRAAEGLRYRDFLTVVLIVKREEVFPDNWIYIHSPEIRMGRIQNYKNWSPEMVPDPSRTSLGLEYFLWDTDDLWSWPDEELIALGTRECVELGLIEPSEVEDGTVVRMPKAYPVYDQTYQENLAAIRGYLETLENLQTIGRNGQHRYNNQDHSMLTGVYAARNITGERCDVWSVNVDQEYLEEDRRKVERLVPARVPAGALSLEERLDELIRAAFARLDPLALGAAVGLVCALGVFLASGVLILHGGPVVGPHLSLLGHFLLGYEVTWTGAVLGALEAGSLGLLLGAAGAWLRNGFIRFYASLARRRANTQLGADIL